MTDPVPVFVSTVGKYTVRWSSTASEYGDISSQVSMSEMVVCVQPSPLTTSGSRTLSVIVAVAKAPGLVTL